MDLWFLSARSRVKSSHAQWISRGLCHCEFAQTSTPIVHCPPVQVEDRDESVSPNTSCTHRVFRHACPSPLPTKLPSSRGCSSSQSVVRVVLPLTGSPRPLDRPCAPAPMSCARLVAQLDTKISLCLCVASTTAAHSPKSASRAQSPPSANGVKPRHGTARTNVGPQVARAQHLDRQVGIHLANDLHGMPVCEVGVLHTDKRRNGQHCRFISPLHSFVVSLHKGHHCRLSG